MKSLILIGLAGYAVLAGSASNAAQAPRTESCKVTSEKEIASLFHFRLHVAIAISVQ